MSRAVGMRSWASTEKCTDKTVVLTLHGTTLGWFYFVLLVNARSTHGVSFGGDLARTPATNTWTLCRLSQLLLESTLVEQRTSEVCG